MKEKDLEKPHMDACGTTAGYRAHRRRGETPCDLCKRANSEYMREYRAGKIEPRGETKADRTREALADADARTQRLSEKSSWTRKPLPDECPAYPPFLKRRGLELWYEVVTTYSLTDPALEILRSCCEQMDQLDRLQAALSSGKTAWFELGDPDDDGAIPIVVNAMLSEHRQTAASVTRMMKELGILEKAAPREGNAHSLASFAAMMGGEVK